MGEFQRMRPFKILAVVLLTIAVVLTVVSLVGPDWVSAAYYEGKIQPWGLWWDCLRVHASFEMCVGADWLAGCAAMVFISLIADVVATGLGVWGLFAKRRFPYVLAGMLSVVSAFCQLISIIVYPIMFTKEVTENADNNAETSDFMFAWTYGVACGTVFFLIAAAVFFFIRVRDEDDAQPMKVAADKPPGYYTT